MPPTRLCLEALQGGARAHEAAEAQLGPGLCQELLRQASSSTTMESNAKDIMMLRLWPSSQASFVHDGLASQIVAAGVEAQQLLLAQTSADLGQPNLEKRQDQQRITICPRTFSVAYRQPHARHGRFSFTQSAGVQGPWLWSP